MTTRTKFARPGSEAARKLGCTCPMTDNHQGLGRFGNGRLYGWIVSGFCPRHGQTIPKPASSKQRKATNAAK